MISRLDNHRALVRKRNRFASECAQNPLLLSFCHSGPQYNSVVYLTYYYILDHICMFTFYTQDHLTYRRPIHTPLHNDHSPSFNLHNIANQNLLPSFVPLSEANFKSNRANNQPLFPPRLHSLYLPTSSKSIHFI